MPRHFPILLLAAPALWAAEPEEGGKKNPVSLLPDGSVLKGVLLPRYDKDRNLIGDLKAQTMTLIDPEHVRGENVLIRFYNPDRSLRGKVALKNALFDQVKSRLTAREPVEITTDRLVARGSGLAYAFQGGEGFLRGPVETWISAPPTTSMNTSTLSNALLAFCFAQLPLTAMPPAYVTEEEIAAIKAQSAAAQPEADKIKAETDAKLTADTAAGDQASKAALTFVNTSGLKTAATEEPGKLPEAKPLEVNPGPDDTVITCDGGMYFDADEGVLVYLKNVTVKDPRFDLRGAEQLKVFFDKKPADPKAPGKESALAGNFGDVKKLIAEGTVVLKQKSVDGKDPVEASGGLLTYNIATGEIIISQRYPWVKQGAYFARAKEPNLTLRLLKDGSFSTQGNWEMGGNLNLKGN